MAIAFRRMWQQLLEKVNTYSYASFGQALKNNTELESDGLDHSFLPNKRHVVIVDTLVDTM